MTRLPSWLALTFAVVLALLGGRTLTAQDTGPAKYAVQVPDGLAFAEFGGYEDWQLVSVSQSGDMLKAIVANPVMIDAYRAGIPDNGKPSPTARRSRRSCGRSREARTSPPAPPCRTR